MTMMRMMKMRGEEKKEEEEEKEEDMLREKSNNPNLKGGEQYRKITFRAFPAHLHMFHLLLYFPLKKTKNHKKIKLRQFNSRTYSDSNRCAGTDAALVLEVLAL